MGYNHFIHFTRFIHTVSYPFTTLFYHFTSFVRHPTVATILVLIVRTGQLSVLYYLLHSLFLQYQGDTTTVFSDPVFRPHSISVLNGLLYDFYKLVKNVIAVIYQKQVSTVSESATMMSRKSSHTVTMTKPRRITFLDTSNPKPSSAKSTGGKLTYAERLNIYMNHPWGLVDYHMYLTHIESRRDEINRSKECHLLETGGFTQVTLTEELTSEKIPTGTNPTIVFVSLPVPKVGNRFDNTKLVLGFDLATFNLQGYLVESETPLDDYKDLHKAWNKGRLMIDMHAHKLLGIVDHTMQNEIEILETGMLRHYGENKLEFHAGFDMVIAIQFLQFLDDHADLLFEDGEWFREKYTPFQDDIREIIAASSRSSWFAANDGLAVGQYRQKEIKNVVVSSLFYGQTVDSLEQPGFQ
jgi:hypothetical protein